MRRRTFIALLVGAAVPWPLATRAQPGPPMVGFLGAGLGDQRSYLVPAIRRGLDDAGFAESRNVKVEFRWAEGRYDRLRDLADELLHRGAAVIIADGAAAAVVAKAATEKVPIVFVTAADPVKLGLVASLNRPGANLTGVVLFDTELIAKRLELMRELVPKEASIALLANPKNPNTELLAREVQAAAQARGQAMPVIGVSTDLELDAAFATLSPRQVAALVVQADPFLDGHRGRLVALCARYAVPAIFQFREIAEAGGLISYGPNLPDTFRQVAFYAGRILSGVRPSDLPVVQPTKFELVINLKTAKSLGLAIPPSLLARADEVIE